MKKFLNKIYRFFFPKNFMQEMRRGIEIGRQPGQSVGNAMFQLGKKTRKVVDPKHKMKIGNNKEEK